MPTTSRALLDQITELQDALEAFSFENLSSEEAMELKKTFNSFRQRLEWRIWNPPHPPEEAPVTNEQPSEATSLIAAVSHELRTPLNGIIGFSDVLLSGTLPKRQHGYVKAIRSASYQMLAVVKGLMEHSRLEAGIEDPIARISFNPSETIEDVVQLCRNQFESTLLLLRVQIARDIPETLIGDPYKFSQILLNLLGNALKFTSKGHVELEVKGRKEEGSHVLVCAVRDTGPGIAPEALKQIFEPYHTTRTNQGQQASGLGLGLSIVKQLVGRMRGKIEVESQVGSGSVFTFEIPFEISNGKNKAVSTSAAQDPKQFQGKRIMVFEDNPLNMKLLETRLKAWGCEVIPVLKAPYGLSLLGACVPDLVLMDLRMPDLDGFEATRRIRNHKNPEIRTIPVIAVTADYTINDGARCLDAGIDDTVLKPYTADELSCVLGRHLGVSQKRDSTAGLSETTPKTDAGVSLERLWEECAGDYDMLEHMVELFRANLLEFLGRLKTAQQGPNYLDIRAAAHKVKAGVKLLNADSWLQKIERIHELSRAEEGASEIHSLYEELREGYAAIEAGLHRGLDNIKKSIGDGS